MKKALIIFIGYLLLASFSFALSYSAYDEQTAIDPQSYSIKTEYIISAINSKTTEIINVEYAENTVSSIDSWDSLIFYSLQSVAIKSVSGLTTMRTGYQYDFINGKSDVVLEWVIAEWKPKNIDYLKFDVAAGYIPTSLNRGSLSANVIYTPKKINLGILDINSIGLGGCVQHGFSEKFGAGINVTGTSEKLFGMPITDIFENAFGWLIKK